MYKNHTFIVFAILLLPITNKLAAQDYRYTARLFNSYGVISDIVYARSPQINTPFTNEADTTSIDLYMDLYYPLGDTLSKKPAIIFAHSGGFLTGNKGHEDIIAFCDSFTSRGYVVASIQYRLGMNILDRNSAIRGVYRGIQDGRSAVRFLRSNANTYSIDSSRVYMIGSSAGGFIALHDTYLDRTSEIPPEAASYNQVVLTTTFPFTATITTPDLGNYDNGDNLIYNGKPDAAISLWGALQDTLLIQSGENTPVFLMHGTIDGTVPFGYGPAFGLSTLPNTYGSELINLRLNSLSSTTHQTYFVNNEDHEFHGTSNGSWSTGAGINAYWDTIINNSRDFYYLQHKPFANFTSADNLLQVIFTNNSSVDANRFIWDFGDGNTSIQENPTHTYASDGNYQVKLYVENEILSWDTISYSITVSSSVLDFDIYNQKLPIVIKEQEREIIPIAYYNILGEIVDKETRGLVFILYNNGTVKKTINYQKK